jgi:tripartite-type tricarboxylate transporter receptor subunit TctC
LRNVVKIALVATGLATPLPAMAQAFNAKTVTLVIGFPPGGGYDSHARVFVRYYSKYLPGTPSVIIQNQPGAGSIVAANRVYNAGPKDGSHLGMFAAAVAIEPLIGNASARYDITKFEWIGNLNRDSSSCGVWHTAGVKSWQDASKRNLKIAAAGAGAIQQARYMVSELGAPFSIIYGFNGINPIHLAMQRGEVDGGCGFFTSTARSVFRSDMESGKLKMFLQFSKEPEPFLGGAATVYSLLKSDDDRKLAALIFGPPEIARPIAAPPGTPASIVKVLRDGLDKAVRDPEYMADMKKMQLEPLPLTGAQTAAAFADMIDAPKPLVERAKAIISPPQTQK